MRTHITHYELLPLALQYYIGGRFLALQLQMPVSGTLLHHAVEFFLKAALTDIPIKELRSKKYFGHDLVKLWSAFCSRVPEKAPLHEQYNKAINDLNRFEEIRYPKESPQGEAVAIVIKRQPNGKNIFHNNTYAFVLEEVDSLIAYITELPQLMQQYRMLRDSLPPASRQCLVEANMYWK